MSDPDANPSDAAPDPIESAGPMTTSLLGRLFGVPLLIVVLIVGSVTLVVAGFGWIAAGEQQSIDSLIKTLEAGGGEKKAFGMLAPKDKAYWQAAQELANRLKKADKELTAAQRTMVAQRLAQMITPDDATGESAGEQERLTVRFLMMALARLGDPAGIDVLLESTVSTHADLRRTAATALAEMRGVDGVERAVPRLTRLVKDPEPDVRMVACLALANIARPTHAAAITALTDALLDQRDVAWNAAIALGHLNSDKAIDMLASMLERSYWEGITDPSPQPNGDVRRRLSDLRVQSYLIAAMNAASHVDDPRLNELIADLQDDTDLKVSQAARELVGKESEPAA